MNPPKKLITQQQTQEQQQTVQHQEQKAEAGREFANVEEMLRHDALHTPVPPSIAKRLEKSLGPEGPTAAPWWRRWLGGGQ